MIVAITVAVIASAVVCLVAWWPFARRGGVELVAADVQGGGRRWKLRDPVLNVEAVADHVLSVRNTNGREVMFPHELKPFRKARSPYTADVVQLGAQMAGLRAEIGERFAGFGILEYSERRQFRIEWDAQLAGLLQRAVTKVRTVRGARTAPPRTHNERHICAHCPVASSCDQRLA
ncbi:MAG: CRISPR-associated protein Cas4 [Gemmatimonadaceae bacterium]